MVACAIYVAGITAAYWVVGNVFTDSRRAVLWIKGAAASTAIGGVLILPPAFLVLCYPAWTPTLLIIAASVFFVLCKILFICKGFRIFSIICPHGCFLYYPLQSGNSTFDSGLHRDRSFMFYVALTRPVRMENKKVE